MTRFSPGAGADYNRDPLTLHLQLLCRHYIPEVTLHGYSELIPYRTFCSGANIQHVTAALEQHVTVNDGLNAPWDAAVLERQQWLSLLLSLA